MDGDQFPILGKGELYTIPIRPPRGGGPKKPIRTIHETRERLLPQFDHLLEQIDVCRSRGTMLNNKLFFQVSLDYEYLAKSYFPTHLSGFSTWEMVGSRPWNQVSRDNRIFQEPKLARMLFYQADPVEIRNVHGRLEENDLEDKQWADFLKIDNLGLQKAEDRLISFDGKGANESLTELIFHPMSSPEWAECKEKLHKVIDGRSKGSAFLWNWQRSEESEPIFLPAILTKVEIKKIGDFNPIRAARPMPSVSIPRVRKEKIHSMPEPPAAPGLRAAYPEIGIIDGGADNDLTYLRGWVSNLDITPEPVNNAFFEHGTAVCGAALYGPCYPGQTLGQPRFKIKSFRVFPVPRNKGFDLDLYQVLDWLENIVRDPANRNVRIYSLSFGPNIPVDDLEVDRFTVTLDRLAYDYDVLFFVAAGNEGDSSYPFSRIQPPSDLVNGVGVGSFTYTDANGVRPASYCCVGPGRPGSQVKPDVSAFGGSDGYPFYVLLANTESEVAGDQGTSYATPCIASLAGNLLYRASEPTVITPQTTKALIIHHAEPYETLDQTKYGWGAMRVPPESIMACSMNEVKVLYNGILDLTQWVRLQLPFPGDLKYDNKVRFEWTFVYACGVRVETPDDYTLAGLEVKFRPDTHRYSFRNGRDGKSRRIDDRTSEANELIMQGWKKSQHPLSASYLREQQLRENGKWNTVVRGETVLLRKKVNSPVLDVHALGRGDWEYKGGPGKVNYAAVVTVKVSDPEVDLYKRVTLAMRDLVPVSLRVRARRHTV